MENEGFSRVYVPRTAGLPEEESTNNREILSYMNSIRAKETKIKSAEKMIRKGAEGTLSPKDETWLVFATLSKIFVRS